MTDRYQGGRSRPAFADRLLAVLYCLILMRPNELYREPPKPRNKGDVREGVCYVRATPVLWISFAMLAAIGMLAYNFSVTLPLLVTRALHSTEGMFTVLYSVFSVGAVVSSLVVAQRRLVQMRHILMGAVALGVAMVLLAASPRIGFALPMAFLIGVSSILYMTSTTAIVQVEAKPAMHGRVLALQSVLMMGTTPIGGPLSGWLADKMGARTPILLGGIVCLLAAACGYYASRRYLGGPMTRAH